MNKKTIWTILIIVIGIIFAATYETIDKWQYKHSYKELVLTQISYQNYDMSGKEKPFWIDITTQGQLYNAAKKYKLALPDIDLKTEMLILSFGAELESLKYNLREPSYKTRKKYIGFPHFTQEKTINKVYVYVTERTPLMDVDVAGYPPDYRGEY